MNPQQAGNLGHGFSLCLDELTGMGDLLGCESRARPKPHPARFGRDPAGAGALHDQGPLEVGHAGEHSQHHAPGRCRGIGPRLGKRAQARASLLDALGDLQQVTDGAGQAIQTCDSHHVAGAQMRYRNELGPDTSNSEKPNEILNSAKSPSRFVPLCRKNGPFVTSGQVADRRKILLQRRKRREHRQQRSGGRRLDDEPVPFLAHDGILSWQFEFPGDANGLVASIPKEFDVALWLHCRIIAYAAAYA